MQLYDRVRIINADNNNEYEIVDTTKDREGTTMFILQDYDTDQTLDDVFYEHELEEI